MQLLQLFLYYVSLSMKHRNSPVYHFNSLAMHEGIFYQKKGMKKHTCTCSSQRLDCVIVPLSEVDLIGFRVDGSSLPSVSVMCAILGMITGVEVRPFCEHFVTADIVKFKSCSSTEELRPKGYPTSVLVTFSMYFSAASDKDTNWIWKCSRSNLLILSGGSHCNDVSG